MGRTDWDYIAIPREMSSAIDSILKKDGRKYGYLDKTTFIRSLLGDFISNYEKTQNLIEASKNAVQDTGEDKS